MPDEPKIDLPVTETEYEDTVAAWLAFSFLILFGALCILWTFHAPAMAKLGETVLGAMLPILGIIAHAFWENLKRNKQT